MGISKVLRLRPQNAPESITIATFIFCRLLIPNNVEKKIVLLQVICTELTFSLRVFVMLPVLMQHH